MDPALKKRLIGASVMIVLAIIFLPMLFDGSGESIPGNAVSLDIPAQPERDFETRVVPLDLPRPASGVAEAIGLPAGSPDPEPASAPVADPGLATAPPPAEDPIAAVAAEAAARVDAISGERVDNVVAGVSPAATKPVEPAPVATAPSPKPATSGRFMVNLGSYANVANAGQLESSLRAAGLSVHADALVVEGKAVRRLRLGPYATRAQADNARLKAKAMRADLPASIIEVDDTPAADVPARAVAPKSASAYAVQVAVLSDAAKANARRDAMRQAGFAAFVEKLETAKGTVYRLRIGPEAERSDAERIKTAVQQKFGGEAIIVDYP